MPDDPVSRLEFTKGEIDRVFGRGYSRDHPELTAAVMLSASLDFHGLTLARAVRDEHVGRRTRAGAHCARGHLLENSVVGEVSDPPLCPFFPLSRLAYARFCEK